MKPDIICKDWKNFLGLMFQTKKKSCLMTFNKNMHWNIHTWFCAYTLDIYFLDQEFKVVEKTLMKPWRTYKTRKKAFYALEIPAGRKKYVLNQTIRMEKHLNT
ncbi:MAG: hypothetical protein GOU97_01840 [Nanoarchaeota archaeon]|nr:hypothetical protein [Nanoarchaeota archaeon]